MLQRRSVQALCVCVLAVCVLAGLDLWSKAWAEQKLSSAPTAQALPPCTPDPQGHYYMQRGRGDEIVLVPGYLELRYAENCGAAFGLLDRSPRWLRVGMFITAGTLAIFALLWMFVRGSGGRLFAVAVPLIVSGAVGNMIDRLRFGYVIDFIHFHIHDSFEWPTFNVADSTITVGVALLLLDGLRQPAARPKGETEARPEKA